MRRKSSTIPHSLLVVDSSCGHNWCLCFRQMGQSWRMRWTVCSASLQSQSAESTMPIWLISFKLSLLILTIWLHICVLFWMTMTSIQGQRGLKVTMFATVSYFLYIPAKRLDQRMTNVDLSTCSSCVCCGLVLFCFVWLTGSVFPGLLLCNLMCLEEMFTVLILN